VVCGCCVAGLHVAKSKGMWGDIRQRGRTRGVAFLWASLNEGVTRWKVVGGFSCVWFGEFIYIAGWRDVALGASVVVGGGFIDGIVW